MKQLVATIIWRATVSLAIVAAVLSLLTIPIVIVMVYWDQGLLAAMRVVGFVLSLVAVATSGAFLFEWARRNRRQ